MLLNKIFWFWWRKKKIIWFRVFTYSLMLNSGKKIRACVVWKKKSWTKQKTITLPPPPPFKLNGRSIIMLCFKGVYFVYSMLKSTNLKYVWYFNCSLSSHFTSMVFSQKCCCSKHYIIGLGYYVSLVYQWDHIWDIKTSLTSPLVLTCFYQAGKVTGHVVLMLEVLLILPLSTILLIWIDELQIITESRIVQWQNSIYIAVARIKGLA